VSLGLLVLRLVAGLLFSGHGAQKLFGAFGGAGLEATASGFEKGGLRPGRLHAGAAGVTELAAGLLLALGLLVPLGAAGMIAVMTTAIIVVHGSKGVWNTEGGFEYNLVLIAVAFALAAVGAGGWSLDDVLGLDVAGAGWAFAALGAGLLGGVAAVAAGRQQGTRGPRHAAEHRHAGAH